MADKVPKKFQGSWIVVVLLIIFCWPAAIIYFFTSREPVYQYGAAPQGAYAPQYPPYQPPPQYGQPGYAPPQYGQQQQPPQYGQPPQGYQQPPQQPPAPPTQDEEY